MIDPAKVALFIPPRLSEFKLNLFRRIGQYVGTVIEQKFLALEELPDEIVPVVGCTPELRPIIDRWQMRKRAWIYWDRGYCRRVFATWLPRGEGGGYYRWHIGSYQLRTMRPVPPDRWKSLGTETKPWQRQGKHIVIACPSATYERFHAIEGWTAKTIRELSLITKRQIVVRDKESKRPLQEDLNGAHCLVTHGSNTAVEAAMLGCPVFVDSSSAAALVGRTRLKMIESPNYPERQLWLSNLAYSQFNERELIDGTLWRLIS
jgi:hypothetical protein